MSEWAVVFSVLAVVAGGVLVHLSGRHTKRMHQLVADLKAAHAEELLELSKAQEAVRENREGLVEDYKKERERWQDELHDSQGKEKTHREANALFEQQAKDAWSRYRQAGLMAGHAQAMLLRELETAVRLLNGYRQEKGEPPIVVDEALKHTVSEFKREHAS